MTFFDSENSFKKNAGESWSYSEPSAGIMRFEVRQDDYYDDPNLPSAQDDEAQGKNRSEIGSFKSMQFGREFTVEFDFLLESGASNTADFLLLAQFHQTEDVDADGNVLDAAASPPLALQLRGDRLEIAARTDPDKVTTTSPDKLTMPGYDTPETSTMYLDTDPLPRDTWINIRFEVVFDHAGGGELRVYRDNVLIVDYTGPLGYNDDIGPYLQMGLYRGDTTGPIPETMAAQFQNLVVTAEGTPPAMNGTAGNDNIVANKLGFWEDEVLNGLGGDDTLDGGYGADTMNGGAGNDYYVVNHTGDVVNERSGGIDQGGTDQVRSFISYTLGADIENLILWDSADIDGTGNAGVNTIQGNTGDNVLRGLGGNDSLLGDLGDDQVFGDDGDDKVYGAGGNDSLHGGAGNDEVYGEDGDDSLTGGDGNDTLEGGAGSDTMEGGAGDDSYVITEATDMVVELAGGGRDTARVAFSYDIGTGSHIEVLNTIDQNATTAINLYASDQDNEVRGNDGANTMYGRGGADFMQGFGGNDSMLGGAGADSLYGGAGRDTIKGGTENDQLYGEDGDDSLLAEGGNDTLEGGAGNDTMAGGTGDDEYLVTDSGDVVVEVAGQGTDTVRTSVTFDAGTTGEIEVINTSNQGAYVALDISGDNTANQIRGNNGANRLEGRGGNDEIYGYLGDDTLLGGTGNDAVWGGSGDDSIDGGDGSDTLRGEGGVDTLRGGAGDDLLYTNDGDGGLLAGGAGNDTYYVDAASTTITEGAGEGTDVIRASVSIRLEAGSEIEEIRASDLGGTDSLDFFGSDTAQTLRGNAGANYLDGGAGNDTYYGYGGDDVFVLRDAGDHVIESAGNGTDMILTAVDVSLGSTQEIEILAALDATAATGLTLVGNDGVNDISGDAGNNHISGKGGNDTLYGGPGNDTIYGGTGTDTAVVHAASTEVGISVGGSSAVLTLGTGTLWLSNDVESIRFNDTTLTYAQLAARTGQAFTGSSTAITAGISDDLVIGTTAAETLTGNAGADTLLGGAGNDSLSGGAGNDELHGGAGSDTLSGGTGNDTAIFTQDSTAYSAQSTTGGILLGGDLILSDVEFVRFADRTLTFAEASALVSATPTVTGTDAAENVTGTTAAEIINALGGSDWITPGGGNDTVDGGSGTDMISFYNLADTAGRTNVQYRLDIDMGAGTAVSHDGSEQISFTSTERLTATIYADRIKGTSGDDEIRGLGDYDWIIATEGNDTIDGGTGQDMISFLDYQSSATNVIADIFGSNGLPPTGAQASGIYLDLNNPANSTGLAAGLTLTSVERVTGSGRQDVFYGDSGENDFRGLGDYDWFVSSTGGRERYFGGDGLDTVTYFNASGAVTANLSNGALVNGRETGYGSRGDAARDLYFEIENLVGSRFGDELRGSSERNQLNGLEGDDFIFGYGGVDYLMGGAGNDHIDGGGGSDYALFSGNSDDYSLVRGTGSDSNRVTVTGADGTDTLIDVEYFRFADGDLDIWGL